MGVAVCSGRRPVPVRSGTLWSAGIRRVPSGLQCRCGSKWVKNGRRVRRHWGSAQLTANVTFDRAASKVPRRCSLRLRHRRHGRSPTLTERIAADIRAFLVARSCCRKHMVACPARLAVDGVMRREVAMYPIVRDVSFTRNVASLRTLFCG